MYRRALAICAVAIALVGVFISRNATKEPLSYITGRANTVLFLTDDHNGLSNVHLATSLALLENHPWVEIHYASFTRMARELSRISAMAKERQAAANPIRFHELPEQGWVDAVKQQEGNESSAIMSPGVRGLPRLMQLFGTLMSPWSNEAHLRLYLHMSRLIEDIDPAVVVLDPLFTPALDAATTLNRTRAIISPNRLSDNFVFQQPYGAAFWKYPALSSGFPFPLPWSKVPGNTYIILRLVYQLIFDKTLRSRKEFLGNHGIRNPLQLNKASLTEVPWISASFPESGPPLDYLPPNALPCGPIVLDVAPTHLQDPKLAKWLQKRPTMLVNLGKSVKYSHDLAQTMIEAFKHVLDETTDVQILWKYQMRGEYDFGPLTHSVQTYIKDGRLKIETWLTADPTSILQSANVVVSVHHGGANCFFETVLAGVPHVILPLWFDLYNYAQTVEDLGIGVWPGKETAPVWDTRSLADGFLKALRGDTMRQRAQALAEIAASYGGKETAAKAIAGMAATTTD